jgi:hypothetical protein
MSTWSVDNVVLSSFRRVHFDLFVMTDHLSVGDRWRIISLRFDQKASFNRIASVVNCSLATVHNILRLFRETDDVIEREN